MTVDEIPEECVQETPIPKPAIERSEPPKPKVKAKRDIIRFGGDKEVALSLDKISSVFLEGEKITFEFSTKSQVITCVDAAAAKSIFESVLIMWASEKEERRGRKRKA